MDLLKFIFSRIMRNRVHAFYRNLEYPQEAQLRRLKFILQNNAATEIGRSHHFEKITSFDEYRRALPIREYQDFLPQIERMKRGEENILVSGRLQMFATTSGTTSTPKYCPTTSAFTQEHHLAHNLWMYHMFMDRPAGFSRRLLSFVSPAESSRTEGNTPVGSSSGKQFLNSNPWIQHCQAVPYDVCRITDYKARNHAFLVFALSQPVSVATTVNPSTLVMLAHMLNEKKEELLEDLARGTLNHAGAIEADILQLLKRRLRPCPEKAKSLRKIVKHEGALLPVHAWPSLLGINTWHGGSAPFYLDQLSALWGNVPRRCLGLRASEGTFTIPLADNTASGVLAVCSHVLEFTEGEETPEPDTPTLLAHELEVGKTYRLITTTSGGFYRYDMGDIIRVTGRRANTPEAEFRHRAGNVLSITGEKITEDQVVDLMAGIEKQFSCINGFTVTLELTEQPRYLLAVELKNLACDTGKLLHMFESELRKCNPEYAEKRDSGRLDHPSLILLKQGSYQNHRAFLLSQGKPDGQIKPPHLVKPFGKDRVPVAGCPFFSHVTIQDRIEAKSICLA